MKVLAIITARGGSKRIPKKNIKDFLGKPIISYSIEEAKKSQIFDEIMVSTDSVEIKNIAENFGAKVPFIRSEKTSNDFATTSDVINEVLEEYRKQGKEFDYFVCIYPTAPFISAEKLKKALTILVNNDADSVVPIVKYDFPPQRAFVVENEKIKYQYENYAKMRSQDLIPIYHDCGQFYFCKTASFKKSNAVVMGNSYPIILSEKEVQDIDTLEDWNLAELKYKNLYKQE